MGMQCTKCVDLGPKYLEQPTIGISSVPSLSPGQKLNFSLSIENIKLTSKFKFPESIKFSLKSFWEFQFPFSDFSLIEDHFQTNKKKKIDFAIPARLIEEEKVAVTIVDKNKKVIQVLMIKLSHLCNGPCHHDHFLMELQCRLMFDFHIQQNINVIAQVSDLKLSLLSKDDNSCSLLGYCLGLITNAKSTETYQSSSFDQIYQQVDEEIKQSLQINIGVGNFSSANFRILIFQEQNEYIQNEELRKVLATLYLPYNTIRLEDYCIVTQNGQQFEKRQISLTTDLTYKNTVIGEATVKTTILNNRVCVQQMEDLVYSEHGISTLKPSLLNPQRKKDPLFRLKKLIANLAENLSHLSESLKILQQISQILQKQLHLAEKQQPQLLQQQILLLQFTQKLIRLISKGQDIVNEYLWKVVNDFLRMPQLSLRYYFYIKNIKQRKKSLIRLYQNICLGIQKISLTTSNGVTFKQLQGIQKFIAFAYFRFPWVQKVVISELTRESDPIITPQKLAQLGASSGCKSPSKSIIYDWQSTMYSIVKNQKILTQYIQQFQQNIHSKDSWSTLFLKREDEDLFLGFLIELFNQAQIILKSQKQIIRWEYFPSYGQILSSFLGQMNDSRITSYTPLFKKCSTKLIMNQKLLNPFIMLLFPKTYLYQTYCVLKCLDLIECYFETFSKNKKCLPSDFNFHYFITGINCVLDSNHSYLLIKTLTILFQYYHIFSYEFKRILRMTVLGRKFYGLFLHWNYNVRKSFCLLLEFKLLKLQLQGKDFKNQFSSNSGQERFDMINYRQKISERIQSLGKIHSQQRKTKTENRNYHMNMKEKLNRKKCQKLKVSPPQNNQRISYMQTSLQMTKKHSEPVFLQNFHTRTLLSTNQKFRKWSIDSDSDWDKVVSDTLKKYIGLALKQYSQTKECSNPQIEAKKLAKLFQQKANIDS